MSELSTIERRRVSAFVAAISLSVAACSSSAGVTATESSSLGEAPPPTDDVVDDAPGVEDAPDVEEVPDPEPDVVVEEAPDAAPEERGSLEWESCADAGPLGAGKECATLSVPLDHSDPDGDTIDIAVARFRSPGSDPIGSLVFNPGGPGGSGIEFLDQVPLIMPPDVADRFDLVSFDPRGVGASTALDCDVELDDLITLLEPGDDSGWNALVEEAEAFTGGCSADSLALAPHVGTNNAARDLDLLREALGDEQLSYVGYSYGTRLGATYAEIFPEQVRALVLDAGVAPDSDSFELDRGQADGFDLALRNFADACDGDADCLLADVGPTLDVLDGLRSEIAEVGSFPTDDPERILTPGELELGVITALYSTTTWPFLAQALFIAEAEQDGSLLQALGDRLVGRQPDGSYDNSQVANTFINCADDPNRPDADSVRESVDEAASRSELFDDALRASTGCLGISEAIDPLIIGPAVGAAPIVVIGNSGDPATPFEWSVALADSLESASLYTVEAEGHTAFGSIECVADEIAAYLVDLTVPATGAGCSDNASADFFVPAGESEVDLVVELFDCLRENGADVPDIDAADVLADTDGSVLLDALDPTDESVIEAIGACISILTDLQDG